VPVEDELEPVDLGGLYKAPVNLIFLLFFDLFPILTLWGVTIITIKVEEISIDRLLSGTLSFG
jgi:hypothetical protein